MIAAIERVMTRKTLRGGRMLAAVLALAPLTDAALARERTEEPDEDWETVRDQFDADRISE